MFNALSSRRAIAFRSLTLQSLPQYVGRLPFLYQTRTIQSKRALKEIGREKARRAAGTAQAPAPAPKPKSNYSLAGHLKRSNVSESLHELDESAEPTLGGDAPTRRATVTGPERMAFNKLLKKGQVQSQKAFANPAERARQAEAKASYEAKRRVESAKGRKLMQMRRERMGKEREDASVDEPPSAPVTIEQWPESLFALARRYQKNSIAYNTLRLLRGGEDEDAKADQGPHARELKRIETLVQEAETDVDVWNVLEKEVFSVVYDLDLDRDNATGKDEAGDDKAGKKKKARRKRAARRESEGAQAMRSDLLRMTEIMYPAVLLLAMRRLKSEFPGSSLPLALVPRMKSLGRGSFALAASTALYNELLDYAWRTYAEPREVTEILQDMESSGVDFDSGTLDAIDTVMTNIGRLQDGQKGFTVSKVWRAQRVRSLVRSMQTWHERIEKSVHSEAVRAANERGSVVEDLPIVRAGGMLEI